jgi:hypothetical protein
MPEVLTLGGYPLRRLSQLFALTLLCLSAFSLAHAQTPALQGGVMLECSGLPCVDIVTGQGKHLRMLIDTGNASSIVDAAVAKQIGLPTTPVTGQDGKPVDGYSRAALNGVTLGDASLGTVKVLVLDRRPEPELKTLDSYSQRYTGKPFPFRNPGQIALVIEVEKARYEKLPFQHTPPK